MTITSRQNPLVARFREAARGGPGSLLLLDGAHLIADALAARLTLTIVAVTPESIDRPALAPLLDGLANAGVEVVTVTAPVMDALSPVRSPSPIVALAERPAHGDGRIWSGDLAIMAVDVQDPGNVGAIVRVAEAGGASGFLAANGSADPFGWKALRGSMGSALRLPIASGVDAATGVAEARRRGFRVMATVPRDGRTPADVSFAGPVVVLIGGEGQGLAPSLVAAAVERLTIPMAAPVESLNAAVTAALIVYEARSQRSR